MELLLERIDGVKSLVELVKTCWIELQMVCVATDFRCDVFEFYMTVVESFGQFSGIGEYVFDGMQTGCGSFHLFHSPLHFTA